MEIKTQEIEVQLFWMVNLRIVDRKDDVRDISLVYSFYLL
jgi:hypothetical protein